MKIYYVGKSLDNTGERWDMQGIFEKKHDAVNAVIKSNCKECFVSSITLNNMLPTERVQRKDFGDIGWYPLLEDEPEKDLQ